MNAVRYMRGAFIAYEPGGYPTRKRVIPFRFNPETLSRTIALEAGESGGGVEGSARGAAAPLAAEASSDASSGTLKESFTVLIRLDFADREESLSGIGAELGVAPEIAAIEELLYPAETQAQAASDGSEPVRKAADRPTVLFVWGHKRVLPVRIASLKIDESFYNSALNPIRAEIEASLEVLGEAEARHDAAVRPALDHTHKARRELASLFFANASSQNTNIPTPFR